MADRIILRVVLLLGCVYGIDSRTGSREMRFNPMKYGTHRHANARGLKSKNFLQLSGINNSVPPTARFRGTQPTGRSSRKREERAETLLPVTGEDSGPDDKDRFTSSYAPSGGIADHQTGVYTGQFKRISTTSSVLTSQSSEIHNRLRNEQRMCPSRGLKATEDQCPFHVPKCRCYKSEQGIIIECRGAQLNRIPRLEISKPEDVISLDFGHNQIEKVVKKDLCHYTSLRCIDLSDNRISALPGDVFSCSPNLASLCIDRNLFSEIPEQIFQYNSNIEILSLRAIGPRMTVSKLGPDFNYLKRLKKIELSGVHIPELDKQFVSNLEPTNVSTIELSEVNITDYGANVFEKLPNLTNLTLSGLNNMGSQTVRTILWGLENSKLQRLALERNPALTYVAYRMFEGLNGSSLTSLSLAFSQISLIEDEAFFHIPMLESLHLSNLPITSINDRTFRHLRELRYLSLESCALAQIDYGFVPLQSLLHLDISNNTQLQNLTTRALKSLRSLSVLVMNDLHLDHLHNYTFCDLKNLSHLEASNIKLRHKKYLHIEPDAFHGLSNLVEMSLIASHVATLQKEYFVPLKNVKIIRLRGNSFINAKVIPDCFEPVRGSLSWLDLGESNITFYQLSSGFLNDLTSLTRLSLGNNNLYDEDIPDNAFDKCINLRQVDLGHNFFTHIPPLLKGMKKLQTVSLNHNNIAYINDSGPYDDFAYLRQRVASTIGFSFSLSGNPYNCSCAMVKNFVQWLNTSEVLERLTDDRLGYVCASAPFKDMLLVPMLKFDKKLCEPPDDNGLDDQGAVVSAISMGVAYLIAASVLLLRYVYRWDISWLLFRWRWMHLTEAQVEEDFEFDAFVCYSTRDAEFVTGELIPNLEGNRQAEQFKLAIDFRSFQLGTFIADNIINSMNRSRRTIVLLSQNFLDGNWTMWEYQIAQSRAAERRDRLIVVLLESIPMRKLPRGINKLIKDRMHLEWTDDPTGQRLFWRKMREALRDTRGYARERSMCEERAVLLSPDVTSQAIIA